MSALSATMPWPYEVARSKARHLTEALLLSVWQEPTSKELGVVHLAVELIRESLALHDFVKDGWDLTLSLLEAGLLKDVGTHGQWIRDLIDLCLKEMRRLQTVIATVANKYGEPVAELDALGAAINRLTGLRDHIVAEWPQPDPERTRRRVEDVNRDGGLELDEVFARAAGVTEEEWLRRVREHEAAGRGHP